MTYNNLNQIQNKTVSSISNINYTYDKTGNIKTITDNIEAQKSQSFIYDPIYRVTNATGVYGNIGYTYDPIGNRLKEDMPSQPPDESVSYQYNHNNQITKAIKNEITVGEYFYDGTGKRIKKIANGETTIFHYDIFGNIISETDVNGGVKSDYIYLNRDRVAMVKTDGDAEQNYYYLNDHLGTPAKLTDSSGTVVLQADYYPFGEIYQQNGTATQPFRFPGQYYDSETGLYYNYHRYYGPDNGRYLTSDPIGLKGGVNLFVYTASNPVNFTDFLGLVKEICSTLKYTNWVVVNARTRDISDKREDFDRDVFNNIKSGLSLIPSLKFLGGVPDLPTGIKRFRIFEVEEQLHDIKETICKDECTGKYLYSRKKTSPIVGTNRWIEMSREKIF